MKAIQDQLMEKLPLAFTLSKAVLDAQGFPIDYRLIQINPAFEKKFALNETEAIGRYMSEWLFESERIPESWLRAFAELLATGGRREFEELLKLDRRWYQVTAFVSHSGDLAVLLHDAFRFRRAQADFEKVQAMLQASLESTQAFGQSVFDNNPSAVIIYDVQRDGASSSDYIIRAVNSTSLKMENWWEEDVVGKP